MFRKYLTKSSLTLLTILFFTSLTCSFIIILLIINKGVIIDSSTFDLMQLLVRSAFTLIGASISAGIALILFSMQQLRSEDEKAKAQKLYKEKITEEYNKNIEVANRLLASINKFEVPLLAKSLSGDNNKIKEILLIYFTSFDFSMFDSLIKEVEYTEDLIEMVSTIRSLKQVHKYLKILLEDISNSDPTEKLLTLIKNELTPIKKPSV